MRSILAEVTTVVLFASIFSISIGIIIWSTAGMFRDEVAEGIGSLMIRCGLAVCGGIIAILAMILVIRLALAA